MDSIIVIRHHIDLIDRQIVNLLDQRTTLAGRLSYLKKKEGVDIEDPQRELQVLEKVKRYSSDSVVKEHVGEVFQFIMKVAKVKQQLMNTLSIPFGHIGIIGKGMMGGSIAKSLKTVDSTTQISFLDCEEGMDIVEGIDLLILAIPTDAVLTLAPMLAISATKRMNPLIIMDIASTKREIHTLFERLTSKNIEFVATHPMAGSEKSGIQNACSNIFNGKKWIVTPHRNNHPQTLDSVEGMINCLQARVVYMDAHTHDCKIGLISHMTRVLSSSLYEFVLERDPMSLEVAGTGFTSMTRLACGDPKLQNEMVNNNKDQIVEHLDAFISFLQRKRDEISKCLAEEQVS